MTSPILNLIAHDELDSTNTYLREEKQRKQFPEFTYVTANYQRAGKGQRGNSWESAPHSNLMFSVLLRPECLPMKQHFILSELVSLALLKTLAKYSKHFSIKWPNDLYWKDYKIAGILIENDIEGLSLKESVIGIGLNVNQKEFLSDAPNPISLFQILQKEIDRNTLLQEFHNHLSEEYHRLACGELIEIADEYQSALYRLGDYYTYADKDGEFEAQIHRVADDGTLYLVDEKGKLRKYLFKEVKYIL